MKKSGAEINAIVWWAVGIAILALFIGIMIYNKGSLGGAIAKIRDLFSFRT